MTTTGAGKFSLFSQDPYPCRLAWGRRGAVEAAGRDDILVIVDTLSFSTTVVAAVARGGIVYPCAWEDDPAALAGRVGAEVAVPRPDVPAKGRFSLSPQTYAKLDPGTKVVIASPNGATCARLADKVGHLFVGALVNADAVAAVVSAVMGSTEKAVTVVACGERWQVPSEDGKLRMAIEDYLGAGAILACLACDKSPEARVCEGAFSQTRADLGDILWDCGSGRELRAMGFGEDVEHAARLNAFNAVPLMRGDRLVNGVDEGPPPG